MANGNGGRPAGREAAQARQQRPKLMALADKVAPGDIDEDADEFGFFDRIIDSRGKINLLGALIPPVGNIWAKQREDRSLGLQALAAERTQTLERTKLGGTPAEIETAAVTILSRRFKGPNKRKRAEEISAVLSPQARQELIVRDTEERIKTGGAGRRRKAETREWLAKQIVKGESIFGPEGKDPIEPTEGAKEILRQARRGAPSEARQRVREHFTGDKGNNKVAPEDFGPMSQALGDLNENLRATGSSELSAMGALVGAVGPREAMALPLAQKTGGRTTNAQEIAGVAKARQDLAQQLVDAGIIGDMSPQVWTEIMADAGIELDAAGRIADRDVVEALRAAGVK